MESQKDVIKRVVLSFSSLRREKHPKPLQTYY